MVWGVLSLAPMLHGAEGPDWKARLTRLSAGSFSGPEACELVYHLSWSNILKAGETTIRFYGRGQNGETPDQIYARADVRSSGLARALWPYDAKTESWVSRENLQPVRVLQVEEDRNERNIYRTTFTSSTVENEWSSVEKRPGSSPVVRNRTYVQTDPPIQDLMSAMLFLRSLPVQDLKKPVSLVCYPFRDPYLVTATPRGRETHEMLGRKVPAMKFEVTLAKIESDQSLKVYDEKMKSAFFWISDDGLRLPLELRADIFVGSIIVKLTEYRELGESVASFSPAVRASAGSSGEPERQRQDATVRRKRRQGGGARMR